MDAESGANHFAENRSHIRELLFGSKNEQKTPVTRLNKGLQGLCFCLELWYKSAFFCLCKNFFYFSKSHDFSANI